MRVLGNHVAIDTKLSYTEIKNRESVTKGGLIIDSYVMSFNPSQYIMRSGIISAVPDKIVFDKQAKLNAPNLQIHKCKIEVEVGDEVFFNYHCAIQALGRLVHPVLPENESNPKWIEYNGTIHIFIRYSDLIFSIVKGKKITKYNSETKCTTIEQVEFIKMLNGYVLVEPIDVKIDFGKLIVPETNNFKEQKCGIVRHIGTPNEDYIDDCKFADSYDIKAGYKVYFHQSKSILLEGEITQKLPNQYFYIRNHDIMGYEMI